MGFESSGSVPQASVPERREFTGGDKSELRQLIAQGHSWEAGRRLAEFDSVPSEIAFELIEAGKVVQVADNIDRFDPSLHQMIADEILEKGLQHWSSIKVNLNKFKVNDETKDLVTEIGKATFAEKIAKLEMAHKTL